MPGIQTLKKYDVPLKDWIEAKKLLPTYMNLL